MKRSIYNELLKWKDSPRRKPLMLYGARQVGKTYILKEFGEKEYKNTIYFNCYKNPALTQLFAETINTKALLIGLSALSGETILPGETLLIFDEVQDTPDIVSALKYFCEDAPDFHIATAGSLLGVMNMDGRSFPTGKVDMLHMYPMTFMEFLEASDERAKIELLESDKTGQVINSLSAAYIDLLRQYYFVGGMPEAVLTFLETHTPTAVRTVQQNIINAYIADIAKHAGKDTQRARMVFENIPSQLAKENKKFVFGALRSGARAADYETAIQWLIDASLVYKIERLTKVAVPMNFYTELTGFKLFLLDIGLLGALAQVPPAQMMIGTNIFTDFKGAFTENYVLQQMITLPVSIGYYSKENSSMEIDFIIQSDKELLPIEVKAEVNVKSKSLHRFITVDNADSGLHGYRFSMQGFQQQDWMTNVPLYAVEPFLRQLLKN